MSDGAYLGIDADQALHSILGGTPPPPERLSPEDALAKIRATSSEQQSEQQPQAASYAETAWAAARIVLEYLEAHPEDHQAPIEDEVDNAAWQTLNYDFDRYEEVVTRHGLYTLIKTKDPDSHALLAELGLTGFMWGWGANCARRCLNLSGPQANPALMEL